MLLESLAGLDWDTAAFSNVPESSPTLAALRGWASRNRFHVEERLSPCPVRPIPESFDALLGSMPSRFRTAIRSTRRKLAAAYEVEFGLHEDAAGFEDALATLFANHESRWQARGESGVFVNERRREFYRILTPRLFESGALRFFYLKLDGRIVAQEYCFAHDGIVYLLQEGFDYALAKENIGNALRSYVFDYLIEHQYRAYDFLAGVTRHKMNWSESAPNDVTLNLSRPSLRGHWAFHDARARARQGSAAAAAGPTEAGGRRDAAACAGRRHAMRVPVVVLNMHYSGLGIARSLGPHGVPVYGLSSDPDFPGNFSRYCQFRLSPDSLHEPERLRDFLVDFAGTFDARPILLPTRDHDIEFLVTHREALEQRFTIPLASREVIEQATNKDKCLAIAAAAGIRVPAHHTVRARRAASGDFWTTRVPCDRETAVRQALAAPWRMGAPSVGRRP